MKYDDVEIHRRGIRATDPQDRPEEVSAPEPPPLPILLSRADIAKRLDISERTLRRILAGIPGLQCYRFGRRITFDEADLEIIKAAMREPYPYTTGPSTRSTYVAPRSARTAQDAAIELMRKLSAQRKKT